MAVDEKIAQTTMESSSGQSAEPPVAFPGDLLLARGCAIGDRDSLALFERAVLPKAIARAARVARSAGSGHDIAQALRVRLFVSDGRAPRINDYDGSTPLAAWAEVIARRCALNLLRAEAGPIAGSKDTFENVASPGAHDDALIEGQFRPLLRKALASAVAALDSRQRSVLRLRFGHGVPLDGIAKTFGVSRSTVVRWLATGRATVLELTRVKLEAAMGHDRASLESLLRAVQSNLDLNISSLFVTVASR